MMSCLYQGRHKVISTSLHSLEIHETVLNHIKKLNTILMKSTAQFVCKERVGDSVIFRKTNHIAERLQNAVLTHIVHFALDYVGQSELLKIDNRYGIWIMDNG